MKNKLVLFITGCILVALSSCLGSDNDVEYVVIKDAQISAFSLSNDSIQGLSDVKFAIDQLEERIFNIDSMPYGTVINEKVVPAITFSSSYGVASLAMVPKATGDTIYWNGSDSVDFSQPVEIITLAFDGQTEKKYLAQINIHTVVPDSMHWGIYAENVVNTSLKEQKVIVYDYNGSENYFMYAQPVGSGNGYQLYHSSVSDAKSWSALSLTGLPDDGLVLSQITAYEDRLYIPSASGELFRSVDGINWEAVENTPAVVSLLGVIKAGLNQPSLLTSIVRSEDVLYFAALTSNGRWNQSGVEVPVGFPLSGFGSVSYEAMYHQRLMIAGGIDKNGNYLNSVWGCMGDGNSWAMLTDEEASNFGKKSGGMFTQYDDKFFFIGGVDASGKASKEIYESITDGVAWALVDTLIVLPDNYTARGYSSIQVDQDNFMLIFGGKTSNSSDVLNEIWRGRINRLGFKR